jgi:2-polyprenyl-3-methyl-5-hydroxy-6-metoxy-1,4-benzoquinol methylase
MADGAALEDSGERMVPEYHKGKLIYAEHLIRYRVVQELARDKVVLDIASGSGYGSAMLAETARRVYGIDASQDAIDYATARYGANNITFTVGDAAQIALDDGSVDMVVTFETIEHIDDYETFISEIKRVLKPNGLAVISTPNDLEFAEGNHFHLHEFERDELMELISKYFSVVDEYYQATWKYVAIDTMAAMQSTSELTRPILNTAPLKPEECLYFYFLCSNVPITQTIPPLSAIGEHYSDRAIHAQALADEAERVRVKNDYERQIAEIVNSRSFKFARRLSGVKARLHL